jgi:hypothetical protein
MREIGTLIKWAWLYKQAPPVTGEFPNCHTALLLYSRSHPRVRERKAPGRAPEDGAAGISLGRAGAWGQRPQLLTKDNMNTNGNRLLALANRIQLPKAHSNRGGGCPQGGKWLRRDQGGALGSYQPPAWGFN